MKKSKNILSLVLIQFAFVIGLQTSFAQLNIQRIVINPLNRATIYCSDFPSDFATKLSDEKQKVIVMFRNATVSDSSREAHSNGIITDVYVQRFNKNLEISVILKDKRGYTAAPLIYSRALMVEVFKWDQLTPAEDEYRTGLLAYEANITSSAEKSFEKAVSLGDAEAAVFLGFLRLQQGRVKSALENLLISYKFQTKIPDVFAALSQIMNMNGYRKESGLLSDKFKSETGLTSFPEIVVPDNPDLTENEKHFDSLLSELSFLLTKDSSALTAKKDSVKVDSSQNKRFQKIFESKDEDLTKKDAITRILESFIPPGFSKVLFVFLVLIAVIFIVLVFAYFKWRKKQVENRTKKKPVERKELKTPAKPTPAARKAAADAYQKTGTLVDTKIGGADVSVKKDKPPAAQENKKQSFEQTFGQKLNELAEKLDQPKKDILLAEREKTLLDSSEEIKLTPKLELALHLLEEQQKLKEKTRGSIDESEIHTDYNKLKDVAKSLGIVKENIKSKAPGMDENKDVISHLAHKFRQDIDNPDK